jgi:hypothetical protein
MRYIVIFALSLWFGPAFADEMYKWTDPQGNVHYSQTRPGQSGTIEKTIQYDKQLEHERQLRAIELERAQLDLQRARQEAGMAGQNSGLPSQPTVPAAPVRATEMSNEDKQKLHQIERDLERVSSSGIGDPSSRNAQVEALMRQQELIYSKYGAQASPRIVIQDQRPSRW